MPAYNFQRRFADAVENGDKRQTIRKRRRRPTMPGDVLYLYTGQRTTACRKLRNQCACRKVDDIFISQIGVVLNDDFENPLTIGTALLDRFARADGFANGEEMLRWFEKTHVLPFRGVVIYW